MMFKLHSSERKAVGFDCEPVEMDFTSLVEAVKYMVDNSFRFSNWSVLSSDIGFIEYVPTGKIAAYVDLNSREVTYSSCNWRE